MKIEIDIPDAELNELVRRHGMNALTSAKMREIIMAAQQDKIEAIVRDMDVSKLVRMEIDATMQHVIGDSVRGRLRAIARPIVEQEIARIQAEAAIEKARGA